MKSVAFVLAAGVVLAGCTSTPMPPRDTGSMAIQPGMGGTSSTVGNPTRGPVDTGNMAYPAPLPQGNVSTTNTSGVRRAPTDTGSMSSPSPVTPGVTTRSR